MGIARFWRTNESVSIHGALFELAAGCGERNADTNLAAQKSLLDPLFFLLAWQPVWMADSGQPRWRVFLVTRGRVILDFLIQTKASI